MDLSLGGLVDDVFGKDDPKPLQTPEQSNATKFLEGLYKGSTPDYPTAPVAELSDLEKQASELASSYGKSTPEGMDYLRNVVGSSDDISEDPAYKALLDQVFKKGSQESNRLGRSLQLRGGATSSTGRDALGRSVENTESNALASLAPYLEAAKNRKFSAANALNSLGDSATINRLNALSTQGALQRSIEQLKQQADYEKQMRELNFPYEVQAGLASSIMGNAVTFQQDPSMFEQVAPVIQTAAMAAMAASDVRVKENIQPVSDALSKIRKLRAYTYNFIGNQTPRVGLIAQELEAVMPEAVVEIDGVKHVDTYALQSLIVQAIAELSLGDK
jgi:hypothetical protein